MAYHYQLPLGGTAKRLSDLYGDGVNVVNPVHDVPYTNLYLQANGGDAHLGSATVSGTTGITLKDGETFTLSGGGRNVKLSEFYAMGAGNLNILGVPF